MSVVLMSKRTVVNVIEESLSWTVKYNANIKNSRLFYLFTWVKTPFRTVIIGVFNNPLSGFPTVYLSICGIISH